MLNRSQASWGQLVPVGAGCGQFNFDLPDSQASWVHLGLLGAIQSQFKFELSEIPSLFATVGASWGQFGQVQF